MSKKKKVKKTYTEGEVRRAIKEAADEAVSRAMLLCILSARDEFDLDEEGVVKFMNTMQRYVEYCDSGLVGIKDYSEALKKTTGIDLRLTRW